MKSKNKRKPVILVGAILLAMVTILAGTFAWFTASGSVDNRLATKDGMANVKIQEVFVEPDDWKPGQTITKEVSIINAGAAPALVRVSFEEMLKVNQPAALEDTAFDAAKETAKKKPRLIDGTLYSGAEWFELTTTANAAKGGIKLAADYPVKVYAKHNTTGSTDSYSFVVWAEISGTSYNGMLQDVYYEKAWNNTDKILALNNIKYFTYQGEIVAEADWADANDRAVTAALADPITKSIAETKINQMADVAGKYPNRIKLNYDNITDVPTADKWFFNTNDGYFYYVGLVSSGTVTPNMLGSLLLDPNADSEYYSNLTFELTVKFNAIQNTKDAVAAEWNITDTNLKAAIENICES